MKSNLGAYGTLAGKAGKNATALHILILLQLLSPFSAHAHRLDECLQAVRVSVSPPRVEIEIEITPGVEVVKAFWEIVDKDRDGNFSSAEKEAYARKVIAELMVRMEGVRMRLDLKEVTFPGLQELKEGVGVIRVTAGREWPKPLAGWHRLEITNNHLPTMSVYHVNVMKPKDRTVEILKQSRDPLQRKYVLEFRVTRPPDSGR